ncbi:MAG: YihY/virulence factor BrkB family protein [Acidobacteriota bacterium]|nr:YihY/virulence factor BrkB family protein [Acidobacteriota bacterium]
MTLFRGLRLPISIGQLLRRTGSEVIKDDVLGMAGQLAYFFVLALFPALIFFVSLVAYLPGDMTQQLIASIQPVLPSEVSSVVEEQIAKLRAADTESILTFGLIFAIWSSSGALIAIISTLNRAYDITEGRPWWKVRLVAIGLTFSLAIVVVAALVLMIAGPMLAAKVGAWLGAGPMFTAVWNVARWPVIFLLVSVGIALVYHQAPDAEQEWVWITPGAILATVLWVCASLGLQEYMARAGSFNETYGTLGGAMAVLLWLYVSGVAILVGGEMNAEIEHASPDGKNPGEKHPCERRRLVAFAKPRPQTARTASTV